MKLIFLLVCGFCNYANAIEVISLDTNGDALRGFHPQHSLDGKQIAFVARVYNSETENFHTKLLVRERVTSTTYLVNDDEDGGEGPFSGILTPPSISSDGRIVVFAADAASEIDGSSSGDRDDVFLHDRDTGLTELVSVDSSGNQSIGSAGSIRSRMSANGRFALFSSNATDLVPGGGGLIHLYVHDRLTKETTRVSQDSFGSSANSSSQINFRAKAISADGRWIVYNSSSTNLVAGDTNGFSDIFLHDRITGETRRINVSAAGNQANDNSFGETISQDGKYIHYETGASNLTPNDLNGERDLFTYDVANGTTSRFDFRTIFSDPRVTYQIGTWSQSDDGRYIVVEGDLQAITQVFVHDRETNETVMVSVDNANTPGNNNSGTATISGSGSTISFHSKATNLVDSQTSGGRRLYSTDNLIIRSNIEYDISLPDGMDLDTNSGGGFVISNNGSAQSAPFRIKLWWSIDDTFDDTDLNELSPVINTVSVDQPEPVLLDFKMPMPPPDGRMSPRLNGDTLSPSEWIGQFIYARGCMMDVTGLIELKCKTEQVRVQPPTPDALQATNGIGTDLIELSWAVPPTDGENLLVDSYRIEEVSDGGSREIEARIEDMEVVMKNGEPHYLLKLRNRTRGKRLDYARRKACLDNGSGEPVCSTWAEGESIGNSIGDALASTDLRGKIQINWATFGAADQGYFLTRCEDGKDETCIDIGQNYRSNTHSATTVLEQGQLAYFINSTSFVDTEVERDKTYVYTIKVCDVSNGTSCQAIYPFRLSNQGQSNLVDDFEDDDINAQATNISSSTEQTHSFDTADDQDWFKLIIKRPQSVKMITSGPLSYDTEITLYNAQIQQIDYNDDAATTFAELTTTKLAVGEYFIKVNQKYDPEPFFYRPVANYYFELEMESIVITPIIMLLLDDE